MRANLKISYSKIVFILLGLNLLGSFIWAFGLHTLRMTLIIASSFGVFMMFVMGAKDKLSTWLKVFTIMLLAVGLYGTERSDYFSILLQDICALGIWFSVLLIKPTQKQIYRGGMLLFFVALIFYVYSIPKLSISAFMAGFESREEAFALKSVGEHKSVDLSYVIYMTQTLFISNFFLFLMLSPFLYKSLGKFKMRLVFLLIAVIVLFISVYYQKKQSLLEFALLILLIGIFYRRMLPGIYPRNLVISLVVSVVALIGIAQSSFFDSTFKRFSELYENLDKFDRAVEASETFDDFSAVEFALGKGLGSVAPNTPGYSVLHIGYANLILKGGILFLLLYLLMASYNLYYCFKRAKFQRLYYVGVVITIFSMFQFTYVGGYLFYMQLMITGLALFSRYPLDYYVANAQREANNHVYGMDGSKAVSQG